MTAATPRAAKIGARLRELRLDAEMTQAEVSRRTGIHRPIVARIERGVHEASLPTIARYAGALELDMETVMVCLDPDWAAADVTLAHARAFDGGAP